MKDIEVKAPGSKGEKELQEEFGTKEDAFKFYNQQMLTHLSPLMQDFIVEQELMFISTSDASGECDASFRAGEKGFVWVLDKHHLIYPEYKGNGVMASMGNISENPNIGLLFLDFFKTKVGLHVNGKAEIVKKETLESRLLFFDGAYKNIQSHQDFFKIVSYILVEVEEAYIHCSIHIPMLKKVKMLENEKKDIKKNKGGDAFCVLDEIRVWSK